MKIVLAVAAIMASTTLLAPTVASAKDSEQVSAAVSYRGLNLDAASGQEQLKKRVALAVRQMCADDAVRGVTRRSEVRACVADAAAVADQQVRQAMAARPTRLAAR